jgi:hypothetical protein
VRTEIEGIRRRLARAKEERLGWHDSLPHARFDEWCASSTTGHYGTARPALDRFYVWVKDMNQKMRDRSAHELAAVGTVLEGTTLTLDDHDLLVLAEGEGRASNARARLNEEVIYKLCPEEIPAGYTTARFV